MSGQQIETMSNEDLGSLYVALKYKQLRVNTAEAAATVDAEIELVSLEIESRRDSGKWPTQVFVKYDPAR
jgi:hypothetical protein